MFDCFRSFANLHIFTFTHSRICSIKVPKDKVIATQQATL